MSNSQLPNRYKTIEYEVFETSDIKVASYLMSVGIKKLNVIAKGNFNSIFVFEQPPQELLNAWVTGQALADPKKVIDSYRHLLRDSRELERAGNGVSP